MPTIVLADGQAAGGVVIIAIARTTVALEAGLTEAILTVAAEDVEEELVRPGELLAIERV